MQGLGFSGVCMGPYCLLLMGLNINILLTDGCVLTNQFDSSARPIVKVRQRVQTYIAASLQNPVKRVFGSEPG